MRAWATLRLLALGPDLAEEVTGQTCAEVWRTLNLSRGGAAFEGFVQGRFVEVLRRAESPVEQEPVSAVSPERVQAKLAELRLRNPRHHQAVELLYQGQATPAEAADELMVDVWEIRAMVARANLTLARSLERPARKQRPADKPGARPRRRATSQADG